jgi:hypothetical protein
MTSEMDNREWLDDYMSLKQVNPNNPFTVPDGYFEELHQHIVSGIKLGELKNAMPANGFTLPENYFEDLGNHIKSRIAVEEILNTDNNAFTVPEKYFEDLGNNIQSRIAVEELLSTNNNAFTIPENYFEDLNNQIKSRLLVERALNNAEDTFTVPQDYFNRLNKDILNKTVNQEVVKRKSRVIRMISSTAFKYATAACIVLMVGAGILFKPFTSTVLDHNNTYLHKELSNISVSDIQGYLDQNVDANETQHVVADEGLPVNEADLKSALQDYSDNN